MLRIRYLLASLVTLALALVSLYSIWYSFWGYGPKVTQGGVEVYYLDGATEAQAQAIADHNAKHANAQGASMRIAKKADGYQLRSVIRLDAHKNEVVLRALELEAARYSRDVFDGAPVETHVCDNRFRTCKVLPPRGDLRYGAVNAEVEVFFDEQVDRKLAEQFAKHYADTNAGKGMTLKIARRDTVYEVHMVVLKGLVNDPGVLAGMRLEGALLSERIFNGAPVEMHLCDEVLRVLRVVEQ